MTPLEYFSEQCAKTSLIASVSPENYLLAGSGADWLLVQMDGLRGVLAYAASFHFEVEIRDGYL